MTMQIGLVGQDGIVLASDTKWVNDNCYPRTSFHASKIKISDNGRVAVSFARRMVISEKIAERIVSELTDSDWERPVVLIQKIAQDALKDQPEQDAHCLIINTHPVPRLFALKTRKVVGVDAWYPMWQEEYARAVTGDDTNPAVYWLESHYQKSPIRNLLLLAATTITAAAKLNSAMIGGLEMVVCEPSGCRRLSPAWVEELSAKAEVLHKSVSELLADCPKQFDYAPHVIR
jgi:hypothetical protein